MNRDGSKVFVGGAKGLKVLEKNRLFLENPEKPYLRNECFAMRYTANNRQLIVQESHTNNLKVLNEELKEI